MMQGEVSEVYTIGQVSLIDMLANVCVAVMIAALGVWGSKAI